MERVLILVVLVAMALFGALGHDPPSEPEARVAPRTDALGEGMALAQDPAIARCVGNPPQDIPELPRVRDLDGLVSAVSGQMVGIRRLTFDRPVDAEFLDSEGIEQRIGELVSEDSDPELTGLQTEAYELLGAIEPGTDVGEVTEAALTSQVAGLYVPSSEELLVRNDGQLGTVELVTLAHELEHALADQALGIPLPDGAAPAGRSDSILARQALVEGDATLAMTFYQLGALDAGAQFSLLVNPETAGAQEDLQRLPDIFQRQLLYPYTTGLAYACRLYNRGGWDAIDRAYANPPGSTAEVLFGERAAEPSRPPRGAPPAEGWSRALDDQLGAASLGWLLAAPGGDPDRSVSDPEPALRGLAGSRLELWRRGEGEGYALTVALRGDAEELCRVGSDFLSARVGGPASEPPDGVTAAWEGPEVSAALDCGRSDVRLGIATDPAVAGALAEG